MDRWIDGKTGHGYSRTYITSLVIAIYEEGINVTGQILEVQGLVQLVLFR